MTICSTSCHTSQNNTGKVLKFLLTVFACLHFNIAILAQTKSESSPEPIDRFALVNRHNIKLLHADTMGALSVGNGEFAFTVDASGLQTFPEDYEKGIPLGTMTQWGWHSMPESKHYSLDDVNENFSSCDNSVAPYPVQHKAGPALEATNVLRANPHRLHLGLVGLKLLKTDGKRVALSDLKNIKQELNLWTGTIQSFYEIDGMPVKVELLAHQTIDQISVRITSPLIKSKRLGIEIRFPYGETCHVCPGYDFNSDNRHTSMVKSTGKQKVLITRSADSTRYYAAMNWTNGTFQKKGDHYFELQPSEEVVAFSIAFSRQPKAETATFSETVVKNTEHWKNFWTRGGAVDFSQCTDERANELERRIVLSQYLTKIQCAGSLPPQETGLTLNSWYGKFHMEMYWWHGAHFPVWGRSELLENSMGWYETVLHKAKATARLQGYQGARWQKMTDPYGNESPSSVGAFIIWQQPHPIYLAYLLYRSDPTISTLEKYREVIFSTADFMTSFLKKQNGSYHLCHPLIPAQEIFKATATDDPTFELQYWHFALSIAQELRVKLGMEKHPDWQHAIDNLAPLPVKDGLYLPNGTTPDAYTDNQWREDHPAVLGSLGFLPQNERMDTVVMKRTFENIMNNWNWSSTWGWDYPLVAMTATRLHQPERAIDALMMATQKNTYLVNGHNYQDNRLRLYLPGNGGLLAAIALMTAGWDGNTEKNPGFPKNGKWKIRWEGMQLMP